MKKGTFLIAALAVAALQTAALGSILYSRANQLSSGMEVVLESRFVDPLDLFRGHYVTLNLIAGELNSKTVETDGNIKRYGKVYVELKKADEGPFWIGKKLWSELPESPSGPVLTGSIRRLPSGDGGNYQVRFPFDRYFANIEKAKRLEKARSDQKLGVILSLDGKGGGMIKGLSLDGKLIYEEPLL